MISELSIYTQSVISWLLFALVFFSGYLLRLFFASRTLKASEREIRVIVDPDKVNDDESLVMARDIRKKIEEGMEYPGQIKVIVLREKRAVEFAK